MSTKIIEFYVPMYSCLLAMIETNVLTYIEKQAYYLRKRSLN